MKPQPVVGPQDGIFDASTWKELPSTRTFCVFHRQSSKYGFFLIFDFFEHADTVATLGFTNVLTPVLVLAGEPANRSAFSQATTPGPIVDEDVARDSECFAVRPLTLLSLPDSERKMADAGNPGLVGPLTSALRTKVLLHDQRVVAGLVHDALGIVAGDVVALDAKADVVGVRP